MPHVTTNNSNSCQNTSAAPLSSNLTGAERPYWALNPAKDEFIFSVADWYHCRLIYEPKARLARVSAGFVALSSHAGISAEAVMLIESSDRVT